MTSPAAGQQAAYEEYCRCWWIYLHHIEANRHFRRRLEDKLPAGTVVHRWPMVWPSVEYLFGTRDTFVESVQYAERD